MRNAPEVHALGPPADTGLALLDYMCRRVGLPSLEGLDVLDFGCGTRFADTIMDRHVPLRSYVGIDVNEPTVRFLATHAIDPRLEFHLLDARNPKYNPFSVITHQQPDDARAIFAVLRRHVRRDGKLFFSAFIDDGMAQDYREGTPDRQGAMTRGCRSWIRSPACRWISRIRVHRAGQACGATIRPQDEGTRIAFRCRFPIGGTHARTSARDCRVISARLARVMRHTDKSNRRLWQLRARICAISA